MLIEDRRAAGASKVHYVRMTGTGDDRGDVVSGMGQRVALWTAAAVVVVVAVGLVMVANGDGDGEEPPALPLASGDTSTDTRAAAAEALVPALVSPYVPTEDLPTLGGEGPAYRLPSLTASDVRRIAGAVGIEGSPVETDGFWHVEDEEQALDVYANGGAWSAYRLIPDGDVAVSSTEPGGVCTTTTAPPAGVDDVIVECELPSADGAAGQASGQLDPGAATTPAATPTADLPSEAEAQMIALDLLTQAGAQIDGADVQVENNLIQWFVTVEPVVDGIPALGMSMFVGVGPGGRIESASGYSGQPERLGDYPLLDTRSAIARLNEGWSIVQPLPAGAAETAIDEAPTTASANDSGVEILPAPDSGIPSTTVAEPPVGGGQPPAGGIEPPTGTTEPGVDPVPGPTVVEPPPTEPPTTEPPANITITGAEMVILAVPSWDDSGTYLVPGYRFVADDGSRPEVPAVADAALVQPPEADPPDLPDEPVGPDGEITPEPAPDMPEDSEDAVDTGSVVPALPPQTDPPPG